MKHLISLILIACSFVATGVHADNLDPYSFMTKIGKGKPFPIIIKDEVPDYLKYESGVVYTPGPDTQSRDLDILYHADYKTVKRPAIVILHGGGWKSGDSTRGHEIMAIYATQGYVTLSINYRLSGTATAPAAVHDCKLAIRWTRANAEKYGIDPDRIGCTGGSAGGHLTAMMAVTEPSDGVEGPHLEDYSSAVQAAMPLSGVYDFRFSEPRFFDPFLGGKLGARKEGLTEQMSPTLLLRPEKAKALPPMLIVHSDNEMVHIRQFEEFVAALKEIGREEETILLPGKGHGHKLIRVPEVREAADKFFRKHLNPQLPVVAEKPEDEKLHVVLLADEKDHGPAGNGLHDYPLWQKRWALLLGEEEASEEKQVNRVGPPEKNKDDYKGMPHVQVTTAWHWPSEEQFQTADVIAAYCYVEWTDERLAQVRRYLEDGGGLVLIHSATWTRPKPLRDRVAEVIGVGGFELFRHGAVKLDLVAPEHPICAGLPEKTILADDETYWPPTPIMEGVTVLATSMEDKAKRGSTPRAAQPLFWTYELGEGRVFGCVPGHCAHTFDDPVIRKLLFRGIAWTARENPLLFDEVMISFACGQAAAQPSLPIVVRDSDKVVLAHEETVRFVGSEWKLDFYRNPAYKAGLSGNYTFLVAEPLDNPGAEAPLWVYLHGGGIGYFDKQGVYHATGKQTQDTWNHEETFEDLRKINLSPPLINKKGRLVDNTVTRRIKEGYRLLVVSMSDHDFYLGLGTPYPNNPKGGEVNGLQATMAAIDYTVSNYPTTHVFAHGASAGGLGVWGLAVGFAAEGNPLTGVVADSGLGTPRSRLIFAAFSGKPRYPYAADFDLDGMVDKIGIFADHTFQLHPEAQVRAGFDDVPVLFIGGKADPRALGGNQPPIAEAAAAGLNNVDWVYDGIRQAVADQPDSPHKVSVIDGAGHSPTNKPGAANDIVDDFIRQILSTDPPYPFGAGAYGAQEESAEEAKMPAATDLHSHGVTQDQIESLAETLRQAVQQELIAGCSFLVAHKGETVFRKAFGYADIESKRLFTTEELLPIASVSKPFMASVLMVLVEQGKVKLEDPVEKYLPEFKGVRVEGSQSPARPMTVRHLLSHTAGFWGNKKITPEKRALIRNYEQTLAESVKGIAKYDLVYEPGTRWLYSGSGYCVAGRVAEVALDQSLEEIAQDAVFRPLGLNRTTYLPSKEVRKTVPTAYLRQRGKLQKQPSMAEIDLRFILPGGSLFTTLDELAVFGQMHLNDGVYNGKRILSEASVTEMRRLQSPEERRRSYGLGWFRGDVSESGLADLVFHNGALGAHLRIDRRREVVTVFLVHQTAGPFLDLKNKRYQQVNEMFPVPNGR